MSGIYRVADPATVEIRRDDSGRLAMLMDADGFLLYAFQGDWSDEQIMVALKFANEAFLHGVNAGLDAKAREIRDVLYIGPAGTREAACG